MNSTRVIAVVLFIILAGIVATSLQSGIGVDSGDFDFGQMFEPDPQGERGFLGNLVPGWLYEFIFWIWLPFGFIPTLFSVSFRTLGMPPTIATILTVSIVLFTALWISNFVRGGGNA